MSKQPKYHFSMTVSTDRETGETLAVYFQVRKGMAKEVREYGDGVAFANYDLHGNLVGVELLEPCTITVLDKIVAKAPAPERNRVRKFFRSAAPREMVLA